MTTFLRNIIAQFLDLNGDIKINDAKLVEVISAQYASMEEYVKQVILPPGEPARLLALLVTPLVLRVSLVCVFTNISQADTIDQLVDEVFSARASGLDYSLSDGLDQHDDQIALLAIGTDYHVCYSSEVRQSEANQVLLQYHQGLLDSPPIPSMEPPLSVLPSTKPTSQTDSRLLSGSIQEEDKEPPTQKLKKEEEGTEEEFLFVEYNCVVCQKTILENDFGDYECNGILRWNIIHNSCRKRRIMNLALAELALCYPRPPDQYKCCLCNTNHLRVEEARAAVGEELFNSIMTLRQEAADYQDDYILLLVRFLKKHSKGGYVHCLDCDKTILPSDVQPLSSLMRYNEGLTAFECPNGTCKLPIYYDAQCKLFDSEALLYVLLHYCACCGNRLKRGSISHEMACNHFCCVQCHGVSNSCKFCVTMDKREALCLKCKCKYPKLYTYPLLCPTEWSHRICFKCRKKGGNEQTCPICSLPFYKKWSLNIGF